MTKFTWVNFDKQVMSPSYFDLQSGTSIATFVNKKYQDN